MLSMSILHTETLIVSLTSFFCSHWSKHSRTDPNGCQGPIPKSLMMLRFHKYSKLCWISESKMTLRLYPTTRICSESELPMTTPSSMKMNYYSSSYWQSPIALHNTVPIPQSKLNSTLPNRPLHDRLLQPLSRHNTLVTNTDGCILARKVLDLL